MSRIGKLPLPLPKSVEVTTSGQTVKVKGPLGELNRTLAEGISVSIEDGIVTVALNKTSKKPVSRLPINKLESLNKQLLSLLFKVYKTSEFPLL